MHTLGYPSPAAILCTLVPHGISAGTVVLPPGFPQHLLCPCLVFQTFFQIWFSCPQISVGLSPPQRDLPCSPFLKLTSIILSAISGKDWGFLSVLDGVLAPVWILFSLSPSMQWNPWAICQKTNRRGQGREEEWESVQEGRHTDVEAGRE